MPKGHGNYMLSFITAAFLTCIQLLILLWPESWTGLAVAGFIGCIAVGYILFMAYSRWEWDESFLLIVHSVFFFLGFPFNALLFSLGLLSANMSLPCDLNSLVNAYRIAILGWICMLGGYFFSLQWKNKNENWKQSFSTKLPYVRLVILATFGMFCLIIKNAFANAEGEASLIGKIGTIFSFFGNFGWAALLILLWEKKHFFKYSVILFILGLISSLLTGQRGELILPFFYLFCFFGLRLKKAGNSLKTIQRYVVIAAVVFVLAYPLLTRFKTAMYIVRMSNIGIERVLSVQNILSHFWDAEEYNSFSENPAEKVLLRMGQIYQSAHILENCAKVWGNLNGQSLLDCIYIPIPRFLWNEKPGINHLATEGMKILTANPECPGAVAVPISSEMFLNFGYSSLIIGMLIFGFFMGKFQLLLGQSESLVRNAVFVIASWGIGEQVYPIPELCSILFLYSISGLVLDYFFSNQQEMEDAAVKNIN